MVTRRAIGHDPRTLQLDGPHGLVPEDLIRVTNETGTFRYLYVWPRDGSLAAWGPVDAKSGKSGNDSQYRAFRPEQLRLINGKKPPV